MSDILEEIVRHEAALHNFHALELAGDRQNFFSIKFNHLSLFVFTDYREEVQKLPDMSLTGIRITFVSRCIAG